MVNRPSVFATDGEYHGELGCCAMPRSEAAPGRTSSVGRTWQNDAAGGGHKPQATGHSLAAQDTKASTKDDKDITKCRKCFGSVWRLEIIGQIVL